MCYGLTTKIISILFKFLLLLTCFLFFLKLFEFPQNSCFKSSGGLFSSINCYLLGFWHFVLIVRWEAMIFWMLLML